MESRRGIASPEWDKRPWRPHLLRRHAQSSHISHQWIGWIVTSESMTIDLVSFSPLLFPELITRIVECKASLIE